jgi:hypothetical protein
MNVANLVTLHVNAAYGLVLEALAVEDAEPEPEPESKVPRS